MTMLEPDDPWVEILARAQEAIDAVPAAPRGFAPPIMMPPKDGK